MPNVHVVSFESSNGEDVRVEVFHKAADAVKRAAEIAKDYSDDENVEEAFDNGDYQDAVNLFQSECNDGADHVLSIVEAPLK